MMQCKAGRCARWSSRTPRALLFQRGSRSKGSTVYTDSHRAYSGLSSHYVHYAIDHAVRYVEGHIHTNNIENFRSCLKRTLGGTYISVRPFHLDAYLTERRPDATTTIDRVATAAGLSRC